MKKVSKEQLFDSLVAYHESILDVGIDHDEIMEGELDIIIGCGYGPFDVPNHIGFLAYTKVNYPMEFDQEEYQDCIDRI